jgi:hypothetical protein
MIREAAGAEEQWAAGRAHVACADNAERGDEVTAAVTGP